jgi:hypothetical protein
MKKSILQEFLDNSLNNIEKEINTEKFEQTKKKILKNIFRDFNFSIKIYIILFLFQLILQIFTMHFLFTKK